MKTQSTFRDLHAYALTRADQVISYVCLSKESRIWAWRRWKDWEGWPEPGSDGPIHDNKVFITRYGNGSRVEFVFSEAAR